MTFDEGTMYLVPRLVFDHALLGFAQRPGDPVPLAIYDFDRCVKAAAHWYEMDADEAIEYVVTQCEGAWLGAGTPLILHQGHIEIEEEP